MLQIRAILPQTAEVEGRHSTATQFAHDGVTVGDGRGDAVGVAIQ